MRWVSLNLTKDKPNLGWFCAPFILPSFSQACVFGQSCGTTGPLYVGSSLAQHIYHKGTYIFSKWAKPGAQLSGLWTTSSRADARRAILGQP